MLNRFFLYIAALSFKAALALGMTVSGAVGVMLGEAFTNQWGAAGLAGTVAAIVGAFLIFIPRYMEQRRKNVETFSDVKDKEMTAVLKRAADLNEREVAFCKLQIAEAQLISTLEREAKHKVIGELTGAQSHNQILVNQLLKCGQTPLVELNPIDYHQLSGEVDKEIKAIRQGAIKRLNEPDKK